MDIDSLVKDNNKNEKKKIFLIKKQNAVFFKNFKNINLLITETIDMIEKDMIKKKNRNE